MRDVYNIIKGPIITEKCTILRGEFNKVAFWVDVRAKKRDVKDAVEEVFNVTVLDVQSLRVPGKKKRMGRHEGKSSTRKKVYVTLGEGERIDIFEGV